MTDLLTSMIVLAFGLGWCWLHIWIGSRSKRRWALITSTIEVTAFSALAFLVNRQIESSTDKSGMMAGGMVLIFAFLVLVIPALLSLLSLCLSRWWRRI